MTFFFNNGDGYLDQSTKMKRRRRQISQISLLLTGIILISSGISIFIFFESIYEFIIKEALKFCPNSQTYQAWITNDPPLTMDIYVFNWTNPKHLGNLSVKPEFEEVGPYTFKEIKEKINVTWDEENHSVSYAYRKLYYYDEEHSARKLSDVINTINAVPLTIGYKTRHANWFTKRLISAALSSVSSLYVTKNVSQILFEGYDEPILGTLSKFPFLDVQDKFGIFYGKNNTAGKEGFFSMNYETGENFGKILSWNDKNQTNFYQGHCNDIKGSAGEFYPINQQRSKLILYSDQLCRYAEMEYVQDVVIKGVKGYKYTGDFIFDNGTTRPDNLCFCSGECIPSGVFNISTCRGNSPSFLSFPHFYQADPYYTDAINGMRPDKTKHEFYITIEPKSGVIMDIQVVMQVNMLLQPIQSIRIYEQVPKVFIPLFYFTQYLPLKDEIASSLRLIQNLPEYFNYSSYILIGIGSLSMMWALCSCCLCFTSKKQKFEINGKINRTDADIPLKKR